jgi:hypothetical protein
MKDEIDHETVTSYHMLILVKFTAIDVGYGGVNELVYLIFKGALDAFLFLSLPTNYINFQYQTSFHPGIPNLPSRCP